MNAWPMVKRALPVLLCCGFVALLVACDPLCSWRVTASAFQDLDGDGQRGPDEPVLENAAIRWARVYGKEAQGDFDLVAGTNRHDAIILTPQGVGGCPDRIEVRATAPEGYSPTTSDEIHVTDREKDVDVWFGFQYRSGPEPTPRPTGIATEHYIGVRGHSGMVVTASGDVWVGGASPAVRRFADGQEISVETPEFSRARDLILGPDGCVWLAGGKGEGVAKNCGSGWVRYRDAQGLTPDDVLAVTATPGGELWALTTECLCRYTAEDDRWLEYPSLGAGRYLVNSQDGTLWLVGDEVHRVAVDRDEPSSVTVPQPDIAGTETRLFGPAWIGGSGLWFTGWFQEWPAVVWYEPHERVWTCYTYETTLGAMPLCYINSLDDLGDGSLFVHRNEGGGFRLIPGAPGQPQDAIWVSYPSLDSAGEQESIKTDMTDPLVSELIWIHVAMNGGWYKVE